MPFTMRFVAYTCLAILTGHQQLAAGYAIPFARDVSTPLASRLSPDASIYSSSDPEFGNVSARWTTWHHPTFSMTVEVATEEDVSATVKYAVENNVEFFAQGGGHGYSGTLDVVQQAIQINMKTHFNTVSFQPADNTVVVGGGANFSQLVDAAYAAGRELTVGSCPCVGAIGAALAGGHGRLQGVHGLSQDAIKSLRVVLADGSIVNVSADENEDLWWAMRGAGQNFGIVVSATFNTWEQTNNGMHYDAEIAFTGDKLQDVLSLINGQLSSWPAELATGLLFAADPSTKQPIIAISLIYAGPESDAQRYSEPFKALGPVAFSEDSYPWNELAYKAAGGGIAASCVKGLPRSTFSSFVATLDPKVMQDAWNGWIEFLKEYPGAAGSGHLWEIFGTQGVHAIPSDSSAYANRDEVVVMWLLQFGYSDTSLEPSLEAYGKTWRDQFQAASGFSELHTYTNYARGDEPLEALYGYGPDRLPKLRALKQKYDPTNMFNGYHGLIQKNSTTSSNSSSFRRREIYGDISEISGTFWH